MLGHSDFRITLATYTDATYIMQLAATAALEEALS